MVRAPGCGPGGQGFDSLYSPHILNNILGCSQVVRHGILIPAFRRFESFHPSQIRGPLAQLAEHLTFNQVVPRSNRGWITIFYLCGRGGIGRRVGLRIRWVTVGVQVPSTAPYIKECQSTRFFICKAIKGT